MKMKRKTISLFIVLLLVISVVVPQSISAMEIKSDNEVQALSEDTQDIKDPIEDNQGSNIENLDEKEADPIVSDENKGDTSLDLDLDKINNPDKTDEQIIKVENKKSKSVVPKGVGATIADTFPDPYFAQVVANNVSAGDVNAILTEDMVNGFTFLVASNTQISSLEGIGNLTSLNVVALDDGQITNVPSEIGNLTSLTYLNLTSNKITKLPKEIGNLTSLGVLALQSNYLTSLPQEIENMTSLVSLEVSENLLPKDAGTYLENLPSFTNVSVNASSQLKIQLTNTGLVFNILKQQDINDIQSMGSTLTNVEGNTIPASHTFILDHYKDDNGPVDINDYIQNGIVIKSGTIYAKVRATGEGLFPNNSDNAVTDDYVKLNFEVTYYNLSFNLNGGQGIAPTSQKLYEGQKAVEPSNPTRDGYTFKGWNTDKDGSGTTWEFDKSTMSANDVTLYAQWDKNAKPVPPTPDSKDPGTISTNKLPETGDYIPLLIILLALGTGLLTSVKSFRKKIK